MLTYEIICGGSEAIAMIAGQWTALCNEGASADPFLRPEWFSALTRTFGLDLKLLTIRRDGRLRAVLPLTYGRSQVHGLPIRSLHSAYDLNTPRFGMAHGNDPCERDEVTAEAWSAIGASPKWEMFETRMAACDDWLAKLTDTAKRDGQFTGVWQMDAAPYITLKDANGVPLGIDDYFSGPRRHFARELNRRQRRLEELGEVEYHVRTEYSNEAVQRYLDLETRGWKGRGGTAAVQDDRAARLHHDFAEQMAAAGKLRAYELTLDGKMIAMSLNINDGGRVFHWKTTYDEAFSKFSPGNLLFRRLLTDALAESVDEIDLLSPSTPNKRVWATGERPHAAFYIFRRGIVARLSWAWKFLILSRLRRFKRK